MKVILDNNLSPGMAKALSELFFREHEVVALREKFDASTPDKEWIEKLSREGNWVVLSGDRRITRNRAELEAFRSSRLTGFFLSKGLYKSKVAKQMERILAMWEQMETIAATTGGGAMFELPLKSNQIRRL